MDAQELATNALVNHWPAHLGVKTDAEKIEYLARALEKAADNASCFDCEECEHCEEHS